VEDRALTFAIFGSVFEFKLELELGEIFGIFEFFGLGLWFGSEFEIV